MTDGRTAIVTMETLKVSALASRWMRILCSVDSQVQGTDVAVLGEDGLAVALPQALSQMSNAVQSAQSILDPEVAKCEYPAVFTTMVLKATHDVRVRYVSWLSNLVQTQQAPNTEAHNKLLNDLAVAAPIAEITALEADNADIAKTILVKNREIRRQERAAELLEHDSAMTKVIEKLNEANEAADQIFKGVGAAGCDFEAEELPASAISLSSATLKLMKDLAACIVLFCFEQNFTKGLKSTETRMSDLTVAVDLAEDYNYTMPPVIARMIEEAKASQTDRQIAERNRIRGGAN